MKKSRIFIIDKKIKISCIGILLFLICLVTTNMYKENKSLAVKEVSSISTNSLLPTTTKIEKEETETIKIEEYKDMPRELNGYKVIGELEIEKINLKTYILETTEPKSLNTSVTKIEGPSINQIGNFCITGHNYLRDNMFSNLKKLEQGDRIVLKDTYGENVTYEVYSIDKINPKDVSILSQNTRK